MWLRFVYGSVHQYNADTFISKGNAFLVHGGSEGLYASSPTQNDSATAGASFIQFENITFRKPKEARKSSSELVQAIVLKLKIEKRLVAQHMGDKEQFAALQILQN
ncbi:hypothetical protein GH714_037752 [Hevea brasiliensis]|uniref:Uncharacterized protein n=1 Tax=Hevea brasiliensis TaxID=3981 RepID=A0A6A6KAB8_HEVBR|nr:hypothetical protein GH714_037752 [Hevea brasiliensis]